MDKISINKFIILFILILFKPEILLSQNVISADPNKIIEIEYNLYRDSSSFSMSAIRPIINNNFSNKWRLFFQSEFYFNSNAPNFENMGNRFIGKGLGLFKSINLSYIGKNIIFSVEPYYFHSQNKEINEISREGIFSRLNDVRYNSNSPYQILGLRETQLYIHINNLGIGYSNANMWWGPGIHNSLTMTNNASGFPHILIGTLNEKTKGIIGYNIRYIFSKLDKTIGNPYFTALVWNVTFYTKPIITIGLIRSYLSGGLPTDRPFNQMDAALIVFEQLLIDTKIREYPDDWREHDPWDQVMSGFFSIYFPDSKLKLYCELGTNDHRQNLSDLRAYPDHAAASIFGFRKYGLFNNESLLFGVEYTNLILAKTWKFRPTPNWYNRDFYDYSSYDSRRWSAHSGSDSDDLYFYFGYNDDKISIIPAFNYERHGVLYSRPPEVKMEIRLDIRYKWNDYKFKIYFEREWLEHAGFIPNKWRNGNVIWFGIERDITNMLSNKIGLVNN
tara:strand:- start:3569 stop:5077 length:1509 start_codon:yes stop_codon:yes gene_type:complete